MRFGGKFDALSALICPRFERPTLNEPSCLEVEDGWAVAAPAGMGEARGLVERTGKAAAARAEDPEAAVEEDEPFISE